MPQLSVRQEKDQPINDQLSPWQLLPDPIILHIFSFIDAPTLLRTAAVCKSWKQLAYDEILWKDLFCREWKLSKNISRKPGKNSWREEYKRLKYHTPMVESEVLSEHTDEVLHVSFSHNGEMFATCSKDCSVKVWNSDYPAKMRHNAIMTDFGLAYTQFSQFNETDSLLLVSAVHSPNRTTGEIWIFSLDGEFVIERRILTNPFSVFGTWFNETYLLSGQQRWLDPRVSTFVTWLYFKEQKRYSPDVKKLFKFINDNESTFSNIMVAKSYSTPVEDFPAETEQISITNQNFRQDLPDGIVPDEQKKLLIFATGSRTFSPHQIGFKRFKLSKLLYLNTTVQPIGVKEKVLLNQFWNYEDEMNGTLDNADYLIDMHGQIIGMALSPDHRLLRYSGTSSSRIPR